jgi:hypothetical protein
MSALGQKRILHLLLGIAGPRLSLLLPLHDGPLLRFEFGGPPLEVFRHVHEMKIVRIIPWQFLCQPQAGFGPFSEIPCIHDALLAPIRTSKRHKASSRVMVAVESSIRRT